MEPFVVSDPTKEGAFRVSKWVRHQVLIDVDELKDLLGFVGGCGFYNVSQIIKMDQAEIQAEDFCAYYAQYIESLKKSLPLEEGGRGHYFSSALSCSRDVFYAMQARPDQFIIKPKIPYVQMQRHQFHPSDVDGKLHSMVTSPSSVQWGFQLSYPLIFQHPHSEEFSKVIDSPTFPNTLLFKNMSRWIREHTLPVTFVWKGVKIPTSMRLGKNCFSWINESEQLCAKQISVYEY